MNTNIFAPTFFKRPLTESDIPNVEYAASVEERARRLAAPAPDNGPTIKHNRIVVAERSFENSAQPITEADFPRYGISPIAHPDPVLSVPFTDRDGIQSNFVLPTELAKKVAHGIAISKVGALPARGENQRVFSLGGTVRAFLRVQYYVQPLADEGRPEDPVYFWGQVHAKESEYLIEAVEGAFTTIAEFGNWAELPTSLRRIEQLGRPDYKALGWSEQDIKAWLADDSE